MNNFKNNDPILTSLELLNERYKDLGDLYVLCNEQRISPKQLIEELKNNTEVGISFRNQVYETIISYFMKFNSF